MDTIIISVGGSVIVPDEIDTVFLKDFCSLIREENKRFVLIAGGGKTCRKYIDAAKTIAEVSQEDLDWIGITTTRVNGQLLLALLKDIAYPKVHNNPEKKFESDEKVLIAAGWKPGFSTDAIAVKLAKNLGANRIINVTDVEYVYDKNPKEFPDAKPIEKLNWDEMKEIIGKKWKPGIHSPFDPIASLEAAELGLDVIVIRKDIDNLRKCIRGKEFKGTIISKN